MSHPVRIICLALLLAAGLNAWAAGPATLPPPAELPAPSPLPAMPGPAYTPTLAPAAAAPAGAPVLYETSGDAAPDQTVVFTGRNLTGGFVAWGPSAGMDGGQRWDLRAQYSTGLHAAATVPPQAPDGPFLVWAYNDQGASAPLRINVPQLWWCSPSVAVPGAPVQLVGRDLARRPHRTSAVVYLAPPGKPGAWLQAFAAGKYTVTVLLPANLAVGDYQLWVHAGMGGQYGWSQPLPLTVKAAPAQRKVQEFSAAQGASLQDALTKLGAAGGGVLRLGEGVFSFRGTLQVPAGVRLQGLPSAPGSGSLTRLQMLYDPSAPLLQRADSGWNLGPTSIQTVGDLMEYRLEVAAAGDYVVWLRYATHMAPYGQPGVSGCETLQVDEQPAVTLENLPNTGSWNSFQWSRSAVIKLPAGTHALRWTNVKGGGINLDAFVLAKDPAFQPGDNPFPEAAAGLFVLQAERPVKFVSREGTLPGVQRPAVWLSGDGAALESLSLSGTPLASVGVLVAAVEPLRWVQECEVRDVRVADCDGQQGENCGVMLRRARRCAVESSDLWGRTPLLFEGVRQCRFIGNRLFAHSLGGGNSLAAIISRCDIMEECAVESNLICAPPGAESGGPTASRMMHLMTGHGSVLHNWIGYNGVEVPIAAGAARGAGQVRFNPVAGGDQNLGETILLEACHRTMYYGPLAGADATSVSLPATVPDTPQELLGEVPRSGLAHDAQGRETPFWPPDDDTHATEPGLDQYFVTVVAGVGQGQTRRVVKREGTKLLLERPWQAAPVAGSVVTIGTGYYQNHLVGNYTPDGMTGVQLWISGMENVIAQNTVNRQRRQGIYLWTPVTTRASSMPLTWNRGIAPLFFNQVEGNSMEECYDGVLVRTQNWGVPMAAHPLALGNVVRHNTAVRSRRDGFAVDTAVGTVLEFNVVRDAPTAFHALALVDGLVLRRNHAYFWEAVLPPTGGEVPVPVGFRIDDEKTGGRMELNEVEGPSGEQDPEGITEVLRGGQPVDNGQR